MANVLPVHKQRILWKCFQEGTSIGFAKWKADVSYDTASRHFRRYQDGFVPEFLIAGKIASRIPEKQKIRWRSEARARRCSVYHLAAKMMTVIAEDDLFKAILGPSQNEKVQAKREAVSNRREHP